MKNLTLTLIILVWLQLLSFSLSAKETEGRFNLKEGDWFEVQVENHEFIKNDTIEKKYNRLYFKEITKTFLLLFQLEKQLSNGNQQYIITLQRFVERFVTEEGINYGFDSYYPEYYESKTVPYQKKQYKLEISSKGKIVSFQPSDNYSYEVALNQISPKKNEKYISTSGSIDGENYVIEQNISTFIKPIYKSIEKNKDQMVGISYKINSDKLKAPNLFEKDSVAINVPYLKETQVPLLIKLPWEQFTLTDASFPILNNSIITGKVAELKNQEISISMLGEYSDSYFPEQKFKTNDDGTFNCPILLKRPFQLLVKIGIYYYLTTFMEPGDTLDISAFGYHAELIEKSNYFLNTKPGKYFSTESEKSDYFNGSAAYNTMLSNEIDQYRIPLLFADFQSSPEDYCLKMTKEVTNIIESYKGKASPVCIEFFQYDWKYFMATQKIKFFKRQQKNRDDTVLLKNKELIDFNEVDSMQILMNPFEWDHSYHEFLPLIQDHKRERFGYLNDERIPYYFTLYTLSGYPLYSQLTKIMMQDFHSGYSKTNTVESYYNNFINNCSDPVLVKSITKTYMSYLQLKIGHKFPVSSFELYNKKKFSLKKYKGKPICLILLDEPKSSINQFKEEILKFRADEVEFIFAQLRPRNWQEGGIDGKLFDRPNVTCIELADSDWTSKFLLDGTKIFMLDKWFRIVENNAENRIVYRYPKNFVTNFEKSLRNTIDNKCFSKDERSAFYKTIGWSFGSIIITIFIGLWFYKNRIKRLNEQEAAKRRIKELEIKAVRSQMNPHFIFNALNSIQSLINGSQFKEANIYLSKFATLLRGVLHNSEKVKVTLSDELQAVELYCQLEQLRFGFKFEITIAPEVNADLIEIPGMIIQPLVENAIVHGLSLKGSEGKLAIHVEQQNGNLCVCVTDNGVGLNSQKVDELSQKGFGLKLVDERIKILNLDGKEANLKVESNHSSAGTTATLIIPLD